MKPAGSTALLYGFQDDVAVGGGVAGADEADGVGDEFLKIVVGEAGHFDCRVEAFEAAEGGFVFPDDVRRVGGEEFLGLPDAADLKVVVQEVEEVGDRGDAAAVGDVHGFDLVPVGKGPVGDDEGVGMPDTGEEMEDVGVEYSFLDHGEIWLPALFNAIRTGDVRIYPSFLPNAKFLWERLFDKQKRPPW